MLTLLLESRTQTEIAELIRAQVTRAAGTGPCSGPGAPPGTSAAEFHDSVITEGTDPCTNHFKKCPAIASSFFEKLIYSELHLKLPSLAPLLFCSIQGLLVFNGAVHRASPTLHIPQTPRLRRPISRRPELPRCSCRAGAADGTPRTSTVGRAPPAHTTAAPQTHLQQGSCQRILSRSVQHSHIIEQYLKIFQTNLFCRIKF